MKLQHITKRSQPQGTQHPFRHIVIFHGVTLQIIPIAIALVAFHSNAKLRLDIFTITMKGTFVQLILILISVGITPLISNLLKGKYFSPFQTRHTLRPMRVILVYIRIMNISLL